MKISTGNFAASPHRRVPRSHFPKIVRLKQGMRSLARAFDFLYLFINSGATNTDLLLVFPSAKPVGVGESSRRLIVKGERSGLRTQIAGTASVSWCTFLIVIFKPRGHQLSDIPPYPTFVRRLRAHPSS